MKREATDIICYVSYATTHTPLLLLPPPNPRAENSSGGDGSAGNYRYHYRRDGLRQDRIPRNIRSQRDGDAARRRK
jgi:hypothetical protein